MGEDLSMTTLQSSTTDELIAELEARSEAYVLVFALKAREQDVRIKSGGLMATVHYLSRIAYLAADGTLKKRMKGMT